MSSATIRGDVILPDGRVCKAVIRGDSYPDTYWDQGGFEIDEEDPLEITWMDDSDLTDEEWNEYGDYVFDWLLDNGTVEEEVLDYEGSWGQYE